MLIEGIWAYAVVELLFVALIVAGYLYWQNRRLRRASATSAAPNDVRQLTVDDYTALLQQHILQTEAKLAHLESAGSDDKRLISVVNTRLKMLQAERKAIDGSGYDEDRLWSALDISLDEFLPPGQEDKPAGDQTAMLTALQSRLLAYQQRIANLEKFKDNFFALKQRHNEAAAVNQRLHQEVEKAIPVEEQSPELKEAMQFLKEENLRLEQELTIVEQEFDGIMRKLNNTAQEYTTDKPDIAVVNSMDSIGQKVGVIKEFVNGQDAQIRALNGIISDLQLELEDKQRLQDGIDKLQAQNTELNDAIDIIQEENTFLQEQISALLKQELETDKNSQAEIDALRTQLDQQIEAHAELESRYAAMESEYLSAYEENQKLKGK